MSNTKRRKATVRTVKNPYGWKGTFYTAHIPGQGDISSGLTPFYSEALADAEAYNNG